MDTSKQGVSQLIAHFIPYPPWSFRLFFVPLDNEHTERKCPQNKLNDHPHNAEYLT